jgi:outer membrane receptor for monomeric catechols
MFVRKFFGLSVASAALLGAAAQAQGTQAHGEDDVRIEDTVVVTGQQTPYMRLSETATKTGQDLMDTPLSVTMLNASFLEDLRTESLADGIVRLTDLETAHLRA